MGNCHVLGLTRAVTHHRIPAGLFRHHHRLNRLAQRADLIWLDQNRVASLFSDRSV